MKKNSAFSLSTKSLRLDSGESFAIELIRNASAATNIAQTLTVTYDANLFQLDDVRSRTKGLSSQILGGGLLQVVLPTLMGASKRAKILADLVMTCLKGNFIESSVTLAVQATSLTEERPSKPVIVFELILKGTPQGPPLGLLYTLPEAISGEEYLADLASFSGVSGALWDAFETPPGLTLNKSGMIYGVPSVTGANDFEVTAYFPATPQLVSATAVRIPVIGGAFELPAQNLNPLNYGFYESMVLHAKGGLSPIQWNLVSGTLPQGITLSTNGTVSGHCNDVGQFPIVVSATDASDTTLERTVKLTCVYFHLADQTAITDLYSIAALPNAVLSCVSITLKIVAPAFSMSALLGNGELFCDGQLLYSGPIHAGQIALPLQRLRPGIRLLKIQLLDALDPFADMRLSTLTIQGRENSAAAPSYSKLFDRKDPVTQQVVEKGPALKVGVPLRLGVLVPGGADCFAVSTSENLKIFMIESNTLRHAFDTEAPPMDRMVCFSPANSTFGTLDGINTSEGKIYRLQQDNIGRFTATELASGYSAPFFGTFDSNLDGVTDLVAIETTHVDVLDVTNGTVIRSNEADSAAGGDSISAATALRAPDGSAAWVAMAQLSSQITALGFSRTLPGVTHTAEAAPALPTCAAATWIRTTPEATALFGVAGARDMDFKLYKFSSNGEISALNSCAIGGVPRDMAAFRPGDGDQTLFTIVNKHSGTVGTVLHRGNAPLSTGIMNGPEGATCLALGRDASGKCMALVGGTNALWLYRSHLTGPYCQASLVLEGIPPLLKGSSVCCEKALLVGNSGSESLIVQEIGLTAHDGQFQLLGLEKFPLTLQPGEVKSFDIVAGSASASKLAGMVGIVSNDPLHGLISIPFKLDLASTSVSADLYPTTIDWHSKENGALLSRSISAVPLTAAYVVVESCRLVGDDAGRFTLQGLPPGTLLTQNTQVHVSLNPTTRGHFAAVLLVQVQAEGQTFTLSTFIAAVITVGDVPAIMIPPALHCGSAKIGQSTLAHLPIHNAGDADLVIDRIEWENNNNQAFSLVDGLPHVVAPGAYHQLIIRFSPTAPGPQKPTLKLHSNDPQKPVASIVLNGTVLIPNLLPPVQHINMTGIIAQNLKSNGEVDLCNAGSAPVCVNLVGLTGPFAIKTPTFPVTLSPSALLEIEPLDQTQPGIYEGTLTLSTDDPAYPLLEFSLKATWW